MNRWLNKAPIYWRSFQPVLDIMMMRHVVIRRHDLQVLNSIVRSITIDVMNIFRTIKFSAKMLLHHPSVFAEHFAFDVDQPVTKAIYMTRTHRSPTFACSDFVRISSFRPAPIVRDTPTSCSVSFYAAFNATKPHWQAL